MTESAPDSPASTSPASTPASLAAPHEPRSKRARVAFFVILAVAILGTFVGERLGWITNTATRDRTLERPTEAVVAAVRSTAAALHWTPIRDDGQVLQWEATTSLLGLVEDVRIELQPFGKGTLVHLSSMSRFGASDFGSNARRLDAFLKAFDAQLK